MGENIRQFIPFFLCYSSFILKDVYKDSTMIVTLVGPFATWEEYKWHMVGAYSITDFTSGFQSFKLCLVILYTASLHLPVHEDVGRG